MVKPTTANKNTKIKKNIKKHLTNDQKYDIIITVKKREVITMRIEKNYYDKLYPYTICGGWGTRFTATKKI